jgi:hypothetical protein
MHAKSKSIQGNGQEGNAKDNRQNQQQDAGLTPRALLVVARLLQIHMCTLRRIVRDFDVFLNNIQLCTLLMHHVSNITEQLVQLSNTLLDVAYLGLALDDERLLEIDFILICQPQLLLLLLLAKVAGRTLLARRLRIQCGTRGLCRSLLLVEGGFLELLELGQGGAELSLELGLRELLRGLLAR